MYISHIYIYIYINIDIHTRFAPQVINNMVSTHENERDMSRQDDLRGRFLETEFHENNFVPVANL